MSKCASAEDALALVMHHGVVLASARGPAPSLAEAIAGEPIRGSWWAHPQSHRIHAILEAVSESKQILVCRLINGRITLIHRRLWPALVRIAGRFVPGQLAQIHDEHTPAGRHVNREVPFPQWVPPDVAAQAKALSEQQALVALAPWLPAPALPANRTPRENPGM